MVKRSKQAQAKRQKVTFVYHSGLAAEIALVGDFNNWNPKKHAMKRDGSGNWTKSVMLMPGTYEYKFWVDGEWREDPHNTRVSINSYGTCNNIVTINTK